jgi:iron complex outermembrane receptor protein
MGSDRVQVGGRYDWEASRTTGFTVQGDAYGGRLGLINSIDSTISGGNALARLRHEGRRGLSQLSAYFDRVERTVAGQFGERRHTFDADAQHSAVLAQHHALVFGGGYRASSDDTDRTRSGRCDASPSARKIRQRFEHSFLRAGSPRGDR